MITALTSRLPEWLTPDPALTDSGLEGELLVARTRLLLAIGVFFIPVVGATHAERDLVDFIALFGSGTMVVLALAVWSYVRKGGAHPLLPFSTSLFDVSVISAISVGYLLADRADAALNSRLTFPAYFLALAATCLRYDVRICLVTGFAAVAQYAFIALVGASRYAMVPTTLPSYAGPLDWTEQVGRLFLLVVGTALAVAIVDRVRRLRLLSTHDALTGLYNRAYFDERVAEELLRARRYKRALAIGVLDLDYFKEVNDRHGHAAGDEVLRRFAEILRSSFRRTDIVARYGGEEFAIALPETDPAEAEAKLEQIRRTVADTPVSVGEPRIALRLTFSAGMAHYPNDGDKPSDLVRQGDENLLSAKREGRNRVVGSTAAGRR